MVRLAPLNPIEEAIAAAVNDSPHAMVFESVAKALGYPNSSSKALRSRLYNALKKLERRRILFRRSFSREWVPYSVGEHVNDLLRSKHMQFREVEAAANILRHHEGKLARIDAELKALGFLEDKDP